MMKYFMNFLDSNRKHLGLIILTITCILISIGCIFVYSSSSIYALLTYNNTNYFFIRQLIFAAIGVFLLYVISSLNGKIYEDHFFKIYVVIICLLISVHFVGTGMEEVGAKSWIRIKSFGIQPSELGKILTVLTFSYFYKRGMFNIKQKSFKSFCIAFFMTILPLCSVLLEPDLGTCSIIAASLVFMLFFTSIPVMYFICTGAVGVLSLSVFMTFAAYRMNRIKAFLDPWAYSQGIGYHIIQSYYAISNGGLLGQGIGNSKQKYLWLPEQHTDFIFSIITEEVGFIGITVILLLFLIFFILCLYMAHTKKNLFQKFSIIGLGSLITYQAFLNVAVAVGLFPITGVTLPFISYGGSSLICSCINVGIILSIYDAKC